MKRLIVIIALSATPLFADDVYLKGGGQITGEIISQTDDEVKVDIGGGTITARMSSVVRIEKNTSPLQEFRARAEKIAPDDVEAWRDLARWATSRALSSQAARAWEHVLEILPDDEEANQGLGRVRLDGRWVSEEESYIARGYVQFEGSWMTPTEKQRIISNRKAREAEARQANEEAIRAIEEEQRAEREQARTEAEQFHRESTVYWGWGTGPRSWPAPVPSRPAPSNPIDRQTGGW